MVGQQVDAVGRPVALLGARRSSSRDDTRDIGRGSDRERPARRCRAASPATLPLAAPRGLPARRRAVAPRSRASSTHRPRTSFDQRRPGRLEARAAPQDERSRPDLGPVEEPDAAHLVRDRGPGQGRLDRRDLRVHPDQHRDLGGRDAVPDQPPDRGDDARRARRRRRRGASDRRLRAGTAGSPRAVSTAPSAARSRLASSRTCGRRAVVLGSASTTRAPGCRSAKPVRKPDDAPVNV